jgi:3,4-dihydroxy-2-butanone 4-phosphate synthase
MDTKEQTYNTIEEAIQELQSGRIVMVADDPGTGR